MSHLSCSALIARRSLPVFALLLSSVAAVAAPARLARPGDAEGDAVRAVASDYYSRVAVRDIAGAHSLFAGSTDGPKLIDATITSTAALDSMVGALVTKFGPSDTIKAWQQAGSAYKLRQGAEAKQKLVIISGDEAFLAGSAFADPGMRFKKVDGAWKIVGLTPSGDPEGPYTALAARLTTAADSVRSKVDTFTAVEGALGEFAKLNDEAMTDFSKALDAAPPEVAKPAGMTQVPTGESLQGLIGKTLDSQEVTIFLGMLNSLPDATANADGTTLTFPSAGVNLSFEPKGNTLAVITVHEAGDNGFAKYPGPLPVGLQFGARRAIIEQLLGKPVWSLGEADYAADFPTKGVTLTFTGAGPRDPDASLRRMDVTAPKPEAPAVATGVSLQLVAAAGDAAAVDVPVLSPQQGGPTSMKLENVSLANADSIAAILPNFDPATGNWGVELTFDEATGKNLSAATANAKGRTLAVLVGGRIITTVPLDGPLGQRVVLNLGNQVPPESARGLAGQLHAATFTLTK